VHRAGEPRANERLGVVRRIGFPLVLILSVVLLASCSSPPVIVTLPSTTVPPGPTTTTTTKPPTFPGFLAQSVSFVTLKKAYVLGVVSCPTGACLAFRETIDHGVTWTTLAPPPTTLDTTGTAGVAQIKFANVKNGWAYGASLWSTHNGAASWEPVGIGGTVVALASSDGLAYALVSPCPASTRCTTPGKLYRTPIAKDAWTVVPGVTGVFTPTTSSLVVVGRTVFVSSETPTPQILSSPTGVTFTALPIPCAPASKTTRGPFIPASLSAVSPSDMAVMCLGHSGSENQFKQAFVSSDGGHTYHRLPDPPATGEGADLVMAGVDVVLYSTISNDTSVVASVAPFTAWSTRLNFKDGGIGLSDLSFFDKFHGAVIYGAATASLKLLGLPDPPTSVGHLYFTHKSGASWHVVQIPV